MNNQQIIGTEEAELLRVKARCSELDVDYLEDPDPWIELRLNRIRLGACDWYLAHRDRV